MIYQGGIEMLQFCNLQLSRLLMERSEPKKGSWLPAEILLEPIRNDHGCGRGIGQSSVGAWPS